MTTRTWEIVLTPAAFTADGRPITNFTITECVPGALPLSHEAVDFGDEVPVHAARRIFEHLQPDVTVPFSVDRVHAGYWVSVYTVTKVEHESEFDALRLAGKIGADTYPGVLMPLTREQYGRALTAARDWLFANLDDYTAEAPYKVWNRLNANYPAGVEGFIERFHFEKPAAFLCRFCREAFDDETTRLHHEHYNCSRRPGLRGD